MFTDLITLCLAVLVLLGSPGPATLALAGVGAAYGPAGGLPFLSGLLAAVAIVLLLSAFGVAAMLAAAAPLRILLQVLAAAYILYLALRVYRGAGASESVTESKAPGFSDGFILNIINPKAYAAFAAIFASFGVRHGDPVVSALATAALTFVLVCMIDFAWLAFGGAFKRITGDTARGALIRAGFAIMMAATGLYSLTRL
ncbi:MAG: LysE family transporter [Pseudomonadota bacterium]